jgi:hypothetical protein
MTLDANGISKFRIILRTTQKLIEDLLQKQDPVLYLSKINIVLSVLKSGSFPLSYILKTL